MPGPQPAYSLDWTAENFLRNMWEPQSAQYSNSVADDFQGESFSNRLFLKKGKVKE